MALDLAALKAKLAARKAAEFSQSVQSTIVDITEVKNDIPNISEPSVNSSECDITSTEPVQPVSSIQVAATNTVIQGAGTSRTVSIDHLDFLSKLQELQEALHHQHPKMPVLLMLIHKQLRTDPELVSTLSEEEIGTIVNGLKIQTKTEMVGTLAKQSKAKDKKTKLDASMF